MFRLLVVPHYHFQRIACFHTTLPVESTPPSFSIGSFAAEDEFNRKTRSSASSGKV